MLKFISTGSAFNAARGNNSAFLKTGQTLVLLDCGGTIFSSLVNKQLLSGVAEIWVVITHPHPDHVGSLGDLILYNQHYLFGQVKIIHPHPDIIDTIMGAMGVKREYYQFVSPVSGLDYEINHRDLQVKLWAHPVEHSANVRAYGYVIDMPASSQRIYYSGDAKTIPTDIRQALQDGAIDLIYQDTASYEVENNPHLSIDQLAQLIPPQLRQRVFCMHLDENFDVKRAEQMGFKIAVSE